VSVHPDHLKDGTLVYKVRWRENGQNRSKTFNTVRLGGQRRAKKLADAHDVKMAELAATGDFTVLDRGTVTLNEYWPLWWERYALEQLADQTLEAYAGLLDLHILPTFGGEQLRSIQPSDVEDWMAKLGKAGVGAPTIRKAATVLQGILKRALRDKEITANPVAQVDKPRAKRKRKPIIIPALQVEQIRAHLIAKGHPGDAALVTLLAYAGPRPESEGITLQWTAVGTRSITLNASKKDDLERSFKMLPQLASDLHAWRRARGLRVRGLVFPFADGHVAPEGKAWTGDDWDNWRDRVFIPAARAVGLPVKASPPRKDRAGRRARPSTTAAGAGVRARDLRNSLASLLIWEGRSVPEVADILGHSRTQCLDTYAGIFEDYDPADRKPATDVIAAARRQVFGAQEATG
jgi:integrase